MNIFDIFPSTCLSNGKIHETEYSHPFEELFNKYFFGIFSISDGRLL